MILYHGTNIIIKKIDLSAGNSRTDFGKGFYMSSKLGRAREWAEGKAGFSGTRTVMRYKVNNALLHDDCINLLRFQHPTLEWLEFVKENRRIERIREQPKKKHAYDAVSGPIANDKANIVVDDYCKGKITASEALERIKVIKSVFQISFHTPLSLTYIESAECQQGIGNGKWSEWKSIK